jgi:hypothetical protein
MMGASTLISVMRSVICARDVEQRHYEAELAHAAHLGDDPGEANGVARLIACESRAVSQLRMDA